MEQSKGSWGKGWVDEWGLKPAFTFQDHSTDCKLDSVVRVDVYVDVGLVN